MIQGNDFDSAGLRKDAKNAVSKVLSIITTGLKGLGGMHGAPVHPPKPTASSQLRSTARM